VPHLGVAREAGEVGDQRLAALVGRVGLAGDQQLDGPLLVQQQAGEPLAVLQQQGQPLVGGHPAGEPDGQHLRVEGPVDPAELALAGPPGPPGPLEPGPDVLDQALAGDPAHLPDVLVGGVEQRRPGAVGGAVVGAEPLLEQLGPLQVDPGARVHPVGDVPDRHLGGLEPGPQAAEHVARHVAVQPAHAVGSLGQAQAHDGHVEGGVVAVGLGPELHDLVDPQAGLDATGPEVALDERAREPVDAGGDRRVGGEDRAGPDRLDGGRAVEALLLDQAPDALQAEEAGVALVGVEHLRLDAEGAQGPDPADPEQDLLAQPVLASAAVQAVGDGPLGGGVLVDVGVEQQQRRPADLGPPHLGVEHGVGQVDGDEQGTPVAAEDQLERQLVGVERRIGLLLAAVGGEGLAEVAGAVEEADADHGHAEVAGRLQVVAGEHAEPARVLGKDLADAELR
jgi:hypothetical protein